VVTAFCVHQAVGQPLPDTLRFAFITDLHFGKTDYNGDSLFPGMWLKKAIVGMERRRAEFILVGGDLIEYANSAVQYAMFDSAMITAIPWYPTPGNHDRGTNNREYYGFVKNQLGAFFVLNTQAYTSTDPSVLAHADSQLVEMDKFFTANAAVPKKFVCAHVPLFINSQSEDSTGYFSIGPAYRRRILSLMEKHNAQYYLAGHRHVDAFKTDGNITVYANTALSFQLRNGNQRGYYIYTVTSGSVERDFFPLSLEPDMVR
jgi:DNA repair exonuclease SbcCD nuclease subunit